MVSFGISAVDIRSRSWPLLKWFCNICLLGYLFVFVDEEIQVFSMLDSQSLCYAAATCSLFNKCAMDPLCYTNIDLTTVVPKVNNAVVSTMIQRAGRALQ